MALCSTKVLCRVPWIAPCHLQSPPNASYISSMGTAASITVIATLAVAVAFLRIRREKLSPALRREYAELAKWAEQETALITNAYARIGQVAERANATDGNDGKRSSGTGIRLRNAPPPRRPP